MQICRFTMVALFDMIRDRRLDRKSEIDIMGIMALIARPTAVAEGEASPAPGRCTYCGTEVGPSVNSCPTCGAMRLSLSPAGMAMAGYATISAGIEQIPIWALPVALLLYGALYAVALSRQNSTRRCIWIKL